MSPRSVQFGALVAEIGMLGSGLGASLKSGYVLDSLGYGYKLSYLSLSQKIGILGLLIFLVCAGFRMVRCVATMVRSDYSASMILALSPMGFLVSAWGNPILFAPVFVCMFCVSLYIERTVAKELAGRT